MTLNLNFLKQRWQRVTARVVIITAAVVLIGSFLINLYFSPILGRTVKNTVLEASDSLYHVDFSRADLHVLRGKIVIFNINVQPDMAVYNRLKARNLHPNNLYRVHIKKLALNHIHPFTLYFKRKLNIGQIILSAPELNVQYQQNRTKDTTPVDKRSLYERISKTLHSINVGYIGLNDVQFKYEDHSGNKVAISELKEMNLSATDLLIDSTSMKDTSRFLYCRDVVTELNNFTGKAPNGLYKYRMKSLTLSTRSRQLNIQNLQLEPVDPDRFFDKSRNDRFTINMDSVQLNDFDFLSYHKYRKLSASSLKLTNGRLGVFNNPYLKERNRIAQGKKQIGDRAVTFPNAGIYKLKTDLKIDSVQIKNLHVSYTELNAKSQKTGYVTFNHTNGTITNLTTNDEALQKNKYCNIILKTNFMSKAALEVAFKFDMAGRDLAYSYKGHLGAMNLGRVNPATTTLGMVKIRSGNMSSFDFDIKANRHGSKGKISFIYSDFKVTLLKPDTAKNKMKKLTLASFFANALIIKHNNPDNVGELPRVGYVNVARPIGDPFFKTIIRTLMSGIKQCIGYNTKKESEMMSHEANRKAKKEEKEKEKERKKRHENKK
ncbi:hypothetical protein [Mucilaginibacter myungsuensis]|uniref:Uncharacterized protein n=1 Tax=Mucilaginibacter myungsuensis TaxID=649104 RepID=A0A929PX34_9SPHI|nr:hypothetical protein [Mucilaginibacter myungsuensis]MBE9663438.1 hypothetical protein [Mucilaginibacter myungsuensis]MDN3600176.1 hypothetical protein [Mucilaginibacter myungsuensis]